MEDHDKLAVIVVVFEDLLTIYASEHHVVDAGLTLLSGLSCHYSFRVNNYTAAKVRSISGTAKLFSAFFSSRARPRCQVSLILNFGA